MTNATPPYIERFRYEFVDSDDETGVSYVKASPETIEDFFAKEIKKAKEEGAEEKMKEVLEIGDELQQEYANGDIFWADLKDKLTKK